MRRNVIQAESDASSREQQVVQAQNIEQSHTCIQQL